MPRSGARRGAMAIEMSLNMLIYTMVFMVLFQLAMVPLQQFFIQTASRSAALVYVQLRHAEGALKTQRELVEAMLPRTELLDELARVLDGGGPAVADSLSQSSTTKDLVTYYVRKDLFGDSTTLPGKLFDPSRIIVTTTIDPPVGTGFFGGLATYFANLVITRQVTVTITYSREFIQGLPGALPPLSIKGVYVCGYAP